MVVFKMRESVPTARYSPVCNVLRQWKTLLILTYRVYRLYDIYTREMHQPTRLNGARQGSPQLENATALGSLIRPRAVTSCNLAVSGMYMRDFSKTHQIAYTYCSVGISDLKPLTGTSADQLPHRKSRSLATA